MNTLTTIQVKRFFTNNALLFIASFATSAFLVLSVAGASAQSLDTTAFQQAITDGMQVFFDNLPAFVLVGFAVFGVIYAFMAGLSFAKTLLMELLSGLGGK